MQALNLSLLLYVILGVFAASSKLSGCKKNTAMARYFDRVVQNFEGSSAVECMRHFDKDQDSRLDRQEFIGLLGDLFTDFVQHSSKDEVAKSLFEVVDKDGSGFVEQPELELAWTRWIKNVVHPVSAFVIVDVQNDFISGSLSLKNCPAKQDPEQVVPVINNMTGSIPFDAVVYTFDWHPKDHISFFDNLHLRQLHPSNKISRDKVQLMDTVIFEDAETKEPIDQKLWPRHCVQETWGAELHKDLKVKDGSVKIYKGMNSDVDSYSAFYDNAKKSSTELHAELTKRGVTDVYTCGLALDVCVAFTTLHALDLGYRTALVDDASRGVSLEDIAMQKNSIVANHGVVVDSSVVKDMVTGKVRLLEMGIKGVEKLKTE